MQINSATSSVITREMKTQAEDAKLRKACSDFESLFIYNLLKNGRQSLPQGGLLGNSNESKIMTSMLDQTLAEQCSEGNGLGIGEMLYRQLNAPQAAKGGNLEAVL